MSDAQLVFGLLGFAVTALQAFALWQLQSIWRELRELRARIEVVELDLRIYAGQRQRALSDERPG